MSLIEILDPPRRAPVTPARRVRPMEDRKQTLKRRVPAGTAPRYEEMREYRKRHAKKIAQRKAMWEQKHRALKNAYQRQRYRNRHGDPSRNLARLGEVNAAAKLDAAKVIEIRRLLESGLTQREVAPMFAISPAAVSNVWMRVTWAHVA